MIKIACFFLQFIRRLFCFVVYFIHYQCEKHWYFPKKRKFCVVNFFVLFGATLKRII